MKKEKKTRGQLISELAKLRQRIAELEKGEAEHKLKEQTLRESKELFEKTFVSQLDALFILDADSPPKILDCNPSATRIFGYSRKEMLGHTTDFLHVDKSRRRKFQEHLYPAIEKQGFFHLPEFEMKRNDGTVFPTEHTVVSLEDEQNKRIGWVSIVSDISDRKRAEKALGESEERYRHLVETMNEGLAMADQDYVFTYVNERFCEMLGYSGDELIGHNLIEFVHDDYKESMKDQIARRRMGEAKRFDLAWRTKDGHKIYTLASPRGFFDAEGRFTGSQGVLTDITDRKHVEKALQKAHDRLEHRTTELVKLNKKLKQKIEERKLAEQELREREAQLEIQTSELEEVNTALRVLLKRRDEDKTEFEEKVLYNVKELILPYLKLLESDELDAKRRAYVSILESNVNDIVSSFTRELSSKYLGLTPTEIQIANLVKQGRTTKEIAEILHSSDRTVEFHRKNIRKKIGIVNKKVNLRSHLLSM